MAHAVIVFAMLKSVSLASHNAVGQLPVMGWSGYNAFMQNSGHCDKAGAGGYNETTFVETMEALKSTGLDKAGYVFLNADDCWIAQNRTADGRLTHDKTRFPHGMAWLAEQAHSRDLKLGLYMAVSKETCRQYPGSQGHIITDANTFAEWGADFVKGDSCSGVLANGTESWARQYGEWADALNATGRQMVFSCSWAVYFTICAAHHPPAQWVSQCGPVPWTDHYIANKCHMWRYGEDLRPNWGSGNPNLKWNGAGGGGVGDVIAYAASFWASSFRAVSGVGAFMDPDFLVVGCPTDRPCEGYSNPETSQSPLTLEEQRTQMAVWCAWGAPLIIGSDIRTISAEALDILNNTAAIAINQDPLAAAPRLVSSAALGVHVWARLLANGDVAVVMVNLGAKAATTAVDIADLVCGTCTRSGSVMDVRSGKVTKASQTISRTGVPAHEAVFVRFTPDK